MMLIQYSIEPLKLVVDNKITKIISDENGVVKLATISIPNSDIQHTLIENINYTGPFLPDSLNQYIHWPIIIKFN